MDINGRSILYIGNYSYTVDGTYAHAAAYRSTNLKVQGGEIVELTAEQDAAIQDEYEALRIERAAVKAAASRHSYMRTGNGQTCRVGSLAEAMEGDAAVHGGRTGYRYSRRERGL